MLLRPRVVSADNLVRSHRTLVAKKNQDSFLNAIIKWIPVEVIGVYEFVVGVVPREAFGWRFGITLFSLVVTPAWIAFATKPLEKLVAWRQVILAPIAFLCWIAALQTELILSVFPAWQPWKGSVVLGFGTLLLPIFDGILKRCGVPQN